MLSRRAFFLLLMPACLQAGADEAIVSRMEIEEIAGSGSWPPRLREMVRYGLGLTKMNLGYHFGSADPALGGMDCSGTVHHILKKAGVKQVPRQSDAFHHWVEKSGKLTVVKGTPDLKDPALAKLTPGDLLFWTGTYDTGARVNPISHVMIYLGKTKEGKPVMFGASDGRPYQGKRQNGVSVFDFRIPRATSKARFVGYGPVPGLDVKGVAPVPPG